MTPRARNWIASLAAIDVVAWVLTLHAHATYHRGPDSPSVMPLGQLLGWIVSIGLLIVIGLIFGAQRQAARYRSGAAIEPPSRPRPTGWGN